MTAISGKASAGRASAGRASAAHVFTEADLLAAAGQRSFDRGTKYLDAVGSLTVVGNQVTASVRGTDEYIAVLTVGRGSGVIGVCDCPHGKEGFFCKHCVAVGLAFLRETRTSKGKSRQAKASEASQGAQAPSLYAWLDSLSKDALLLLVLDQLVEDEDWRSRLELRAASAAADLDSIAAGLATLLDPADFGDYGYIEEGESRRYAERVRTAAEVVDDLVESGHSGYAVAVAEYAIDLVASAYRYALDPASAVWAAAEDLIASHHAACVADNADVGSNPDPAGLVAFLARRMLAGDDFPDIDVASYRELLGAEDLASLREQLTAAWQQAPADWKAQRAIENFLRATGDIDALVKVREANLPKNGLGCLEIAKELQAAGRDDEALAWAERGLHMDGNPPAAIGVVTDFVAERYLAAGRAYDAEAVRREAFAAVREQPAYERLRDAAELAGTWTATREWALDLLRADADAARSGRLGIRLGTGPVLIDVLTSEGEIDAAWQAATGVASEAQWLKLADLAAPTRPADALAVYMRQIQPLKQQTGDKAYERMARLLDGARACHVRLGTEATFDMHLRALRADQKRKVKLLRILDAHQLVPGTR